MPVEEHTSTNETVASNPILLPHNVLAARGTTTMNVHAAGSTIFDVHDVGRTSSVTTNVQAAGSTSSANTYVHAAGSTRCVTLNVNAVVNTIKATPSITLSLMKGKTVTSAVSNMTQPGYHDQQTKTTLNISSLVIIILICPE